MTPASLIGRAGELDGLTRAWSGVAARQVSGPLTVLITGAAGIGKSRLVSAAVDAFDPRPATVLSGAARLHEPAPYDWLAAVLTTRDLDTLPLPADGLAWLAQHPDAPPERYAPGALLRIAVRAVRELAGSGPACLVVEDLHALDPASLNLIGELARVPELPALLLVTSRPPETQLVARTVARLAGSPGAVRQHLRRLTPAEVGEFLTRRYGRESVTADVAAAVAERFGGNPFWLTEMLAAVPDGDPRALLDAPLPGHLSLAASGPGGPELTGRELEVLDCLLEGMSNKQVARSLDISVRTVAIHVSNLLRKTGAASRTEVALWAMRRG